MNGKRADEENSIQLLEENEQAGRGQIWMACICLVLSLLCSALWLVLLLR